jgi:Ca-activated chloride channel homolog
MIELGPVALLRPWWLLAVPAVLAAAILVRRRAGLGAWRRAIDAPLLAALAARGAVRDGPGRQTLAPVLVAGLLALGLAGPAVERSRVETYRNLDGIVLCLDASRSVASGGNIVAAAAAARALVEAAGTRPVAVIAYAGDAYLASPFTADREDLATTLASVDGDTVPEAGSRPERALDLARSTLAAAGVLQGSVILLSDGGGARDGGAAARLLVADGHELHTVHVPPAGALGGVVPAADRTLLDGLAAETGGLAVALSDVERLILRVAEPERLRLGRGDYAALAWRDLGWFLVAAAALPLLALFRREAA